MAQFPVSDQQGIIDGLNYVLSGPQSNGQNFEGFSTDSTGYLTGNFRQPYTTPNFSNLWVGAIALSSSEWLDSRTWKFTFATPQATPPFVNGNNIDVVGVTPSDYDGYYSPIGVISCTTTYVIARTSNEYPNPGVVGTGGTVSLSITTNSSDAWYSTDCNAKVTVTGGTDRVFLSAQLNDIFQYSSSTAGPMTYTVAINRYTAFPNNDPTNPEFIFDGRKTISKQQYVINFTPTGVVTNPNIETIFTTVIDDPVPGYYWYILELQWYDVSGNLVINQSALGFRNFTAQLIKQ
jgi:hypothetical protein